MLGNGAPSVSSFSVNINITTPTLQHQHTNNARISIWFLRQERLREPLLRLLQGSLCCLGAWCCFPVPSVKSKPTWTTTRPSISGHVCAPSVLTVSVAVSMNFIIRLNRRTDRCALSVVYLAALWHKTVMKSGFIVLLLKLRLLRLPMLKLPIRQLKLKLPLLNPSK